MGFTDDICRASKIRDKRIRHYHFLLLEFGLASSRPARDVIQVRVRVPTHLHFRYHVLIHIILSHPWSQLRSTWHNLLAPWHFQRVVGFAHPSTISTA
jgi:hypothetical protein